VDPNRVAIPGTNAPGVEGGTCHPSDSSVISGQLGRRRFLGLVGRAGLAITAFAGGLVSFTPTRALAVTNECDTSTFARLNCAACNVTGCIGECNYGGTTTCCTRYYDPSGNHAYDGVFCCACAGKGCPVHKPSCNCNTRPVCYCCCLYC
jgi:hypothetical protein